MQERQNTSTLGALLTILDMMISCYYYTYYFYIVVTALTIKLAIMASSLQLLVNYIRRKIPIENNDQQS